MHPAALALILLLTLAPPARAEEAEALAVDLLNAAVSLPDGPVRHLLLDRVRLHFPETGAAGMAAVLLPPDMAAQEPLRSAAARSRDVTALDETALGLSPGARARIAAALASLGHDPGPMADGVEDTARQAIRRFQDDHAIAPSGALDGVTVETLLRVFAEAPKSYLGDWVLEIDGERMIPGRPDLTGNRLPLAVLHLTQDAEGMRLRNHYLRRSVAVVNLFGDLRAAITDAGRLILTTRVSTQDPLTTRPSVLPLHRLSLLVDLPEFVPLGWRRDIIANDYGDGMRFRVTLRRTR